MTVHRAFMLKQLCYILLQPTTGFVATLEDRAHDERLERERLRRMWLEFDGTDLDEAEQSLADSSGVSKRPLPAAVKESKSAGIQADIKPVPTRSQVTNTRKLLVWEMGDVGT